MILKHFKQAWNLLSAHPYLSFVSIFGTALSIGLIMIFIVSIRSTMINIAPEVNRTRTLYVKWVGLEDKETKHWVANAFMSLKTIRECFQSLETPEAVTITSPLQARLASVPAGVQKRCFVLFTDDVFWKVYDFQVLQGSLYSKADFDAGIKKVVLSEKMARTLFGTIKDVVGKQMQLNYSTYTVCAIVDNVSPVADLTYAQAWIPFTSTHIPEIKERENVMGRYKCQILAHSSKDFKAIRKEIDQQVDRYNSTLSDYNINLYRQPDTKFVDSKRFGAGYPSIEQQVMSQIILILVILLVPAINLSSFTLSRMRERVEELGIRKTFGCTRAGLFWQVLSENMLYSLLGGILGLGFSYLSLHLMRKSIFSSTNFWGMDVVPDMPVSVFFNPGTFIIAFLFCLAINLLSAGIPAWQVSSTTIVKSLKGA